MIREVLLPCLFFGTHEFAHRYFNLANGFIVTATVPIDDDKLVVLYLLKKVGACEGCLEVGVERILDLLCLADLDPGTVCTFLEKDALGVRFAESIQVF